MPSEGAPSGRSGLGQRSYCFQHDRKPPHEELLRAEAARKRPLDSNPSPAALFRLYRPIKPQ